MEKSYITASEVAQILQVTRSTVYNLVRKGILPAGIKLGHSRRWKLSEVKAALANATA